MNAGGYNLNLEFTLKAKFPKTSTIKHTDTEPVISHLTFEKLPPTKSSLIQEEVKEAPLERAPISLMEGNLIPGVN